MSVVRTSTPPRGFTRTSAKSSDWPEPAAVYPPTTTILPLPTATA
jgi:hypothetical protein